MMKTSNALKHGATQALKGTLFTVGVINVGTAAVGLGG